MRNNRAKKLTFQNFSKPSAIGLTAPAEVVSAHPGLKRKVPASRTFFFARRVE